ncbi:hypothetical protein RRF57_012473 [Xylaria bambusicola]|uniref:Uncharacterized protein n=1 Tax=Xylaria bambusicola TaxID=326684 RepID=A0AAN7V0L6_9PEZI
MWLVLHYRHRLKRLEQKLTARFISLRGSFASSHRADRSGTHELDGADLLREKPDDHIPAEKPDDHIVELPAEEAASSRHQELASN